MTLASTCCSSCQLKATAGGTTTSAGVCGLPAYKGDKNCDDANNNAGCEYDGGDCCALSLGGPVNKQYCKQVHC